MYNNCKYTYKLPKNNYGKPQLFSVSTSHLNFFKQQYEGGFQTQTEAPLLQLLPINQQISHHG